MPLPPPKHRRPASRARPAERPGGVAPKQPEALPAPWHGEDVVCGDAVHAVDRQAVHEPQADEWLDAEVGPSEPAYVPQDLQRE